VSKLLVDDQRTPLNKDGWTIARTNSEACRILCSPVADTFETIFLDHDIVIESTSSSQRLYMGIPTNEDFTPVARLIVELVKAGRLSCKTIVIHSNNYAGRQRHLSILESISEKVRVLDRDVSRYPLDSTID
jgi:hypothetical protein